MRPATWGRPPPGSMPGTTSHTLVQMASRNQRSWVTVTRAPEARPPGPLKRARRWRASQSTPSTSRWLVGSSRMTTSARRVRTAARATRRRWPPERVATSADRSRSAMSPAWMSRTAGSEAHSCSGAWPWMAVRTVAPGGRSSAWLRTATLTPPVRVTRPPSGSRRPARAARKVDLPAPLGPRTPTRVPSSSPRVTSSRSRREPTVRRRFSTPSRCAISPPPGRRPRGRRRAGRRRPGPRPSVRVRPVGRRRGPRRGRRWWGRSRRRWRAGPRPPRPRR